MVMTYAYVDIAQSPDWRGMGEAYRYIYLTESGER
jgi:hypothetical protein